MTSLSEYYKYISLIANPVQMMMSAFFWASIALILSALLVIFLRKVILVQRRHILLTILAYSYFFVMPLWTAYSCFKYSFVSSLRKEVNTYIDQNAETANMLIGMAFSGNLDSLYVANLEAGGAFSLTGKEAIDSLSSIAYEAYGKTLHKIAQQKNLAGNLAGTFHAFSKKETIARYVKHSIADLLRKKLGTNEALSQHLFETKIGTLLKEGFLIRIVGAQADGFLRKIQKNILVLYFLLLLIPLIEITLAYYLQGRQPTANGSVPSPNQTPNNLM